MRRVVVLSSYPITQLVKESFPLCMRQLHDQLRVDHHLRHGGRMQYGLFLKGIGLTLQQSLTFWRKEFTKRMDPETVSVPSTATTTDDDQLHVYSLTRAIHTIYVTIMGRKDVVQITHHLVVTGLLLVILHQLVITMVTKDHNDVMMTSYDVRVSISSLGCWFTEE